MRQDNYSLLYGPPPSYLHGGINNITTIIFDLGGVLMKHNMQGCIDAFCSLMGEENMEHVLGLNTDGEGIAMSLMERYERGDVSTKEFLAEIMRHCPPATSEQQIIDAWNKMHAGIDNTIWEKIQLLRENGYKIYLLSNNNELHWQHVMQNYGKHILQSFDKVFLSHEMHCSKPHERIFIEVSSQIASEPMHIIFVDDLNENRAAAERYVGWHTCSSIDELFSKINIEIN